MNVIESPICLSNEGSDRATAYNISSKLIRKDQYLFAGWLDAPSETDGPVRIQFGVCDADSGEVLRTFVLGEGTDNHCGPALVLDADQRLHAMIGAHHGHFLYRWSDTPEIPESWSLPEPMGPAHSYPALAIDSAGTLHVAYREKADRWKLQYTRRRKAEPWEPPTDIAISPTAGYNHFMHGLTVGPTGNLHLTFQLHYSDTGKALDGKGRAAGYVHSTDGGDSWLHEDVATELPLTTDTLRPFVACPAGSPDASIRISPHTIDSQDRPWLYCATEDRGLLWLRNASGWTSTDLSVAAPNLDLSIAKSSAMSCDAEDNIHLIIATDPAAKVPGWYDPSLELFHLVFDTDGALKAQRQVTETVLDRARWLPAIEHCDWLRPGTVGAGGFWAMYTCGHNAGLMNQSDYNDALKNRVFLQKLQ